MDALIDIAFSMKNEALNALIANDMATTVGDDVTPPRAIHVVRPPRPADDASGTVVLDVVLLEDGTPRVLRLLRSVSPEADDTAVRAFEQWRFTPAVRDGTAVKVRMNAEVTFHGTDS